MLTTILIFSGLINIKSYGVDDGRHIYLLDVGEKKISYVGEKLSCEGMCNVKVFGECETIQATIYLEGETLSIPVEGSLTLCNSERVVVDEKGI